MDQPTVDNGGVRRGRSVGVGVAVANGPAVLRYQGNAIFFLLLFSTPPLGALTLTPRPRNTGSQGR